MSVKKKSRYALKKKGEAEPSQAINRESKWARNRWVDTGSPPKSWQANWRLRDRAFE